MKKKKKISREGQDRVLNQKEMEEMKSGIRDTLKEADDICRELEFEVQKGQAVYRATLSPPEREKAEKKEKKKWGNSFMLGSTGVVKTPEDPAAFYAGEREHARCVLS